MLHPELHPEPDLDPCPGTEGHPTLDLDAALWTQHVKRCTQANLCAWLMLTEQTRPCWPDCLLTQHCHYQDHTPAAELVHVPDGEIIRIHFA